MNENRHVRSIPSEVMEELKAKTRELNALLAPYAIALTPQERHDLPKMGEKTVSFVEKSFELAVENSDLRPPFLDIEAFGTDMSDARGLLVVSNNTVQASETVGDISLLAGSEAYQAALSFYHYVKLLASQDVPRAKTVYEELKKRFPSTGRKRAEAAE